MAKGKSTLPKDIAVGINKLAEAVEKDKKDLLGEMKEIIRTDESIQKMENKEAKIRFAWTILASRYSSGGGKTYYIKVLSTPQVRKIPSGRLVGDLACMAKEVTETDEGEELGDLCYAVGTFWRDAAKTLRPLERGKTYKATVASKEQKRGISIFGNNPVFEEAECDFPDEKTFFEEVITNDNNYKEIYVNEMDIHEGKFDTDCRILRLTVLKAEEGENDRGEFAYYEVVDDSILGHSTKRIYVDPADLTHGQSSVLYSIGKISIGKEEKVIWNHHFFVPEISYERVVETKAVADDAVDMDDLDEEEEQEEKKTKKSEKEEEPEEEDEEEDIFEA